jgi:hypothetical protein
MRRCLDALIVLSLFILAAFFVHAHARLGIATAKPTGHALRRSPMGEVERPMTRFDLRFREPELARP